MIEALKDDRKFQIAGHRASDGRRYSRVSRRMEVTDLRRSINEICDYLLILAARGGMEKRDGDGWR
jgi:hypothetical protein